MAYIGKSPVIGNFVKLDSITAVNGQAAYTMQNGGSNFTDYESVNQFLVSLNGTIQAPTDSFTVSGSTLTFASNLSTGDVIDFIMVFGNSLSAGTPTDATVSTAKIVDDAVTAAKINDDIISGSTELAVAPADTDEFLVSDAGTIKRIDYSLIKSNPTHVLLSTTTVSSGVAQVDFTSNIDSTYNNYLLSVTSMHIAASSQFRMRLFTGTGGSQAVDTGSNYRYSGIGFRNDRTTEISDGATNAYANISIAQNIGSSNSDSFCGNYYLCNPSSTTFNTLIRGDFCMVDGSGRIAHGVNATQYLSTTAVTGVRFFMESGNIDSGIFKLYGIT